MLFCSAEKLPRYPDEDIWDLAVGIGDYYYDNGETGTAEYFYTIAAELFPGRPGTAAERLPEIRARF